MLPLITNVVPQNTASQANALAAAQSAFQVSQASTSTRQITPNAVNAAGAATAFTPQLPERRSETTQRANVATEQSSRPSIMPDPEFWRLPDRAASETITPLPARTAQPSVAQIAAQQQQAAAAAAQQQQEDAAPAPQQAPVRRFNALAAKKPGIGDSTGLGAYAVANQRNAHLSLPGSTESVI